jgi:UDP-2,4-diacetamido-2,4,6-trideoxy-beta-L-altropyranose hydrolase
LTAVFRFDASTEIGAGHARRCLVLAKALLQDRWSVHIASRGGTADTVPSLRNSGIGMIDLDKTGDAGAAPPAGCDLLVVDHYGLDEQFERSCRPWARQILIIDDLANRRHDCDVLVDQTPGRTPDEYRPLVPDHCRILIGASYALLDPRFALARANLRQRSGPVQRILVSLGATDPQAATLVALAALRKAALDVAVDVVIGVGNRNAALVRAAAAVLSPPGKVHVEVDDMAGLIEQADLAIGAGGVSALERCCLGLPSILFVLADNQRRNAAALAEAGAVIALAESESYDVDFIARQIQALAGAPARLRQMSRAAAMVIDGKGVERVLENCSLPSPVPDLANGGKGSLQWQ